VNTLKANGLPGKIVAGVVTVLIVGFFSFWIGAVWTNKTTIAVNTNRLTRLEAQYEAIVEGQRDMRSSMTALQATVSSLQAEVAGLRRDFRQTKDK
jgi:hypothetical protein